MTIYPVLMVGGAGTRLWPVSRRHHPKQFQSLLQSEHSLFQETVLRMQGNLSGRDIGPPVIIGGAAYEALIQEQLDAIGIAAARIVLEPVPRNTAAVAAVAARIVDDLPGDGLCLLMPSDHHIADPDSFQTAVSNGCDAADDGWIVTFGIKATHPETGYGYIEAGETLGSHARKIDRFVEKPKADLAAQMVQSGAFSWNAGIFLFRPQTMLAEMTDLCPDVLASVDKAWPDTAPVMHLQAGAFAACPSVAVDVAVMQSTQRAAMVGPVACGWSDIGGWRALADMQVTGADTPGVVAIDTSGSLLRTDGSVLVAGVGLEDMIVVAHEGAVLVLPKDRAQDVKAVIAELEARGLQDRL